MTLEFTPAGFDAFQNNITDVSTVLVGTATSTGTASQRLQVTGGAYISGNLGIGTTNPGSLLQVQGNTLITGIATVNSNFVVNGNTLVADATNNRVGIGTTNPSYALHVYTTDANGIFIDDSNTTLDAPHIRVRGKRSDNNASQAFSGQLILEKYQTNQPTISNINLGAIIFGGNYDASPGVTTGMTYGASIGAISDGTFSDINTAPTSIVFNTGTIGLGTLGLTNISYGTEAARITSNRNLLIGTTTETGSKLQVQGDTNINNTLPSTVSYASSFSVAGQETSPQDVSFSNDGKTMYVMGSTGDDITWYTLSTPWDITTSTHVSQFSVAGQLTAPTGFYFRPDGTKFYVVGSTGVGAAATSVNQYSCRTPWDLTTASYDSVAYSVITQDTAPQGVEFKPDGTRMYVVGSTNDSVYQYSLSTPWDLTTVSYGSSFSVAGQEAGPTAIRFSLDGTKLLLTGSTGDDINYYNLSTPWDITTTSFVGIITSVGAAPFNETSPAGLYWKPDGTRLYLTGTAADTIYQFNMTSDADLEVTGKTSLYGDLHIYEDTNVYGELSVSSIVGVGTTTSALKLRIQGDTNITGGLNALGSVGIGTTNPTSKLTVFGDTNINNIQPTIVSYASSFRVATQETEPREVFFSNDGKTMYVLGNTGDDITWYTLSTPWDITTATHVSQFSVAGQLTAPTGFYFRPDGTKFYITGTTGVGAAATSVNQYSCRTPWDLTTASYDSVAYSVITQDTIPQGVEFKPDGTRMYVVGSTNDSVYQYSLSTPWDLTTVSYGSSFSVVSQEGGPEGIRFSLDGTKLLLTGSTGDDVNYYTLSTPWDITTTSFVGIITTVGGAPFGEISPSGLYWKPDGTRLYLSGYTNDTIYQFNMTSDADLEVTGKASLYGNLDVYESTTLYSDLNVNNIVGVGTTTTALKLKIQGDTNLTGRFNVSGSVGIGTTNPLGILQVGSASTTGAGTSMVLVTSAGSVGIGTTNPQYKLQVQGSSAALDTRVHSVAEKTVRIDGNTASLVYNTGSGNIAICTNPTGDITLNVTGIPTDSSFDNYSLTFSVMVNNTGTARSCTVVTLNGLSSTIRWAGGSLAAAIAGVTTTNGMDIYSFTGINTIGSASTTANYYVMGVVNGGYR